LKIQSRQVRLQVVGTDTALHVGSNQAGRFKVASNKPTLQVTGGPNIRLKVG
jgi:hypothetical protein